MGKLGVSRRGFLKASAMAGLTVIIAPIGSRAFAALFEEKILTPLRWDAANGRASFRVDGIAKVTGAKVFARDMRAADMPHWPTQQSHAFMLRATQADRVYQGFDLALLGDELQPDRIVTADDLARDGLAFPAFYGEDMLLPPGKTPAYLGHAVAMLIYHDFARFRFAKDRLQFHDEIIRYGEQTGPLERDPWGTFRFVRVGGATSHDDDTFSSLKDSMLFPSMMRKHQAVWAAGREDGKLDERGIEFIGFAVDGAKRMQVLINDLLTFSRVGRLNVTHATVHLDTTLDTALDNLAAAIEESGAQITRPDSPLPPVTGDATLLTMLWQNLIGNAVKFRREDRPPHIGIDCQRGTGDHDGYECGCLDQ